MFEKSDEIKNCCWTHVCAQKEGDKIRIILTFPCDHCGRDSIISWAGKPIGEHAVYPVWEEESICDSCGKTSLVSPPKKSVIKWIHLSRIEAQESIREDEQKGSHKSQPKRKQRKTPPNAATKEDAKNFRYNLMLST